MDLANLTLREYAGDFKPKVARNGPGSVGTTDTRSPLRRCRTREQGIALITVGHAIEYLIQSRLIQQETTTAAEKDALAILVNANLAVYNEGTEVVPLVTRLRRWFHGASLMKTATVR